MTHALQLEAAGRRPRHRRRGAATYVREKHNVPCAEATLATLATRGGGPPFFLFGRIPIYPEEGLDEWVEQRLGAPVRSSSEARSLAACAAAGDGRNEDEAEPRRSSSNQAAGASRRKLSSGPARVGTEAPAQ